MTITPFLTGRLVYLRGICREDLTGPILTWSDDREVTRYLFRGAYPASLEQMVSDYEAMVSSPNEVELMVVDKEDNTPIGVTGLHAINWVARSAEFRVLIGEKAYWNRGCGTEVAQLMLGYGFEILNLHKIWLGVNRENAAAIRSYEKTGFVWEGELRDEIYRNGRYYNAVRMSLLRNEYDAVKPTWTIAPQLQAQFRP